MDLGALAWIERSNMIENENDIPAFTVLLVAQW
jgi:hypothetical protein